MTRSADDEPLIITIEGWFRLEGRGIVLAPAIAADRYPNRTELVVSIVGTGGDRRLVRGRFLVEHVRLQDGRSLSSGVILLDESAGPVEPGARVTCTRASE